MYNFEPNYEERYYIVTLIGEFTPEECRRFMQEYVLFADKINFIRAGAVTDMRQSTGMSPETQQILTEGMVLSLKLGFTCAGRIFNTITDEMIKQLREANLKAGFLAQYFSDITSAIKFVKDTLNKYPTDPVITRSEVLNLLETRYPHYKIS